MIGACRQAFVNVDVYVASGRSNPVSESHNGRESLDRSNGFTLVELMVVVAILGILLGILLPSIQAARQAARRAQCASHLKQLGLAAQLHANVASHFPTGGWGFVWTGDPDRGNDKRQPGGWVYNLLPYIEQEALHQRGAGQAEGPKRAAARARIATPLAILNCPSRRRATKYPAPSFGLPPVNADVLESVARADYAISVGDRGGNGGQVGPRSLADGDCLGDDCAYLWLPNAAFTGVSFFRSEIRERHITDGLSNTYMLGEKYLNPDRYHAGFDPSDNGHMYLGFSVDIFRLAGNIFPLVRDTKGVSNFTVFGSAHNSLCHFAFCDGSIRAINYGIDRELHGRLANRHDGTPAGAAGF